MTNNYDRAECEVMLTARQGEELRIIKYHNQTAQRTVRLIIWLVYYSNNSSLFIHSLCLSFRLHSSNSPISDSTVGSVSNNLSDIDIGRVKVTGGCVVNSILYKWKILAKKIT